MTSIYEFTGSQPTHEQLFKHLYDLNDLDRSVYTLLIEHDEELQIDRIASEVDRDRTTVYRSVQRLLQAGFVQKDQVNYDEGVTATSTRRPTPARSPTR